MDQEIEFESLHICHSMFLYFFSKKPVARREETCISKQQKTLVKSSPSSIVVRSSIGGLHVKSEKDRENNQNCG